MKSNIVGGFFLPVPPAAGGATEKTWHRLARIFAARGHEVTYVSRQWSGWADSEIRDGVRHVRLPGFDHRTKLWQNLALDALWSRRVTSSLPPADITVVHAVTLPAWLARKRPDVGRVIVMPGRMPKGQFRWYRGLAGVMATSTPVRDRVLSENPALEPITRVTGYPIDWATLAGEAPPKEQRWRTIGYVGRIHREKGLEMLVSALADLASRRDVAPWRVLLCGPVAVDAGGSGPSFAQILSARLDRALPRDRWELRPPVFSAAALADVYRSCDIFAYPSLAEEGETFGVGVAEAMAAGAFPVVSALRCFQDFVTPEVTGAVFDHRSADAPRALAQVLSTWLNADDARAAAARAAQAAVRRYDFDHYADEVLSHFVRLLPS